MADLPLPASREPRSSGSLGPSFAPRLTANAVAEVSVSAIRHNLTVLQRIVGPQVGLCPAVKANAYGHDIRIVLRAMADMPAVCAIAVASLEEAVYARLQGFDRPIIILGVDVCADSAIAIESKLQTCLDYDLQPTLSDPAAVRLLARLVRRRAHSPAAVHVKHDSGMHRLGLPADQTVELCHAIRAEPALRLASLYSHLCEADEPGPQAAAFCLEQGQRFATVRARIEADGRGPVFAHIANSAGALRFDQLRLDMVRPGIAVYGLPPGPLFQTAAQTMRTRIAPPVRPGPSAPAIADVRPEHPPEPTDPQTVDFTSFRPAMRVVSRLVMVKRVPAGECVGYGRRWKAHTDRTIGIVPVGYNDGYRRCLGSQAVMRVRGHYAPVAGTVSMDMTAIDLTEVPHAAPGDPVEVMSDDPTALHNAAALAEQCGTIAYEILCGFGARVQRVARD